MISETNLYEPHHKVRLAIKPGITGMWQVSGRSDITDFEEVVRLDKEYIENWNIGLDMTNRSFLFTCKGKKYIMRIPGEGTDQLINRRQEASVYQTIDPCCR